MFSKKSAIGPRQWSGNHATRSIQGASFRNIRELLLLDAYSLGTCRHALGKFLRIGIGDAQGLTLEPQSRSIASGGCSQLRLRQPPAVAAAAPSPRPNTVREKAASFGVRDAHIARKALKALRPAVPTPFQFQRDLAPTSRREAAH